MVPLRAIRAFTVCPVRGGLDGAAMEPVECLSRVLLRHARARVSDLQHDAIPHLAEPDRDGCAFRRVLADVAEQVGQHLPDPGLVNGGHQPVRSFGPDWPVRFHRPGVRGRVPDQAGQIGLGQVERGGAVQPGEFEQLGDERAHPLRLLLDPAHGVRQLVRAERALPVQLGVTPDGGQRRAQLVGGVRGELADLLLGAQPCPERLLDAVQHGVDGPAQPAHLGAVVGVGHPRGEITLGGDLVSRARHLAKRRQPAADEPPATGREQQDQHAAGDQLGHDDPAAGADDRAGRAGDDDHGPARLEAGHIKRGGPGEPLDRAQPGAIGQDDRKWLVLIVTSDLCSGQLADGLLELRPAAARGEQHDLPRPHRDRGGQVAVAVSGQRLRLAGGRGHEVGIELAG